MIAPGPCSWCGAPGARNLGTRSACVAHAAAFYLQLIPGVWDHDGGIGLPGAGARTDDGYYPLTCVRCGATWTGPAFERCTWCVDELERRRVHGESWAARYPSADDLRLDAVDVDEEVTRGA